MSSVQMSEDQICQEIERIEQFIATHLQAEDKVVIGVSGGLDSDVVTRLAIRALGPTRIKLFIALQEGFDPCHLENARDLASDVGVSLVEIDLRSFPTAFISALQTADPGERFRPDGLLDPSRAKCSVRTVIFSTYLDRGYLVLGSSNRTELETGFFLPLGDGLGHLKPIVHLYKTQVYQLGNLLGTRKAVLAQPASSGFWVGAEDLEDMSFWLYHEAPIAEEISFDSEDVATVQSIRVTLTTERVDLGLLGLAHGMSDHAITELSGLPLSTVERLRKLTSAAERLKRRPLGLRLDNLS